MSGAYWIWNYGEYELYHHLIMSCRREEFGCDYPCIWKLSQPDCAARFKKNFSAFSDTSLCAVTRAWGTIKINGERYPLNKSIEIPKGEYEVQIELYDIKSFPSVFIDSEYLKTDDSWIADSFDKQYRKVGFQKSYCKETDDPTVFPFRYKNAEPQSVTECNGGVLYDFGKEMFGPVILEDSEKCDWISLCYGESENEALDFENAIIREKLSGDYDIHRPARAFRYIFVKSNNNHYPSVKAQYEYLPIEDKGYFRCDNERIDKIFDMCAYTFHLNSREVYLDGIKRDRWCWSGDAYQSFMINLYLYFEPDIIRRTIISLLGKPPYYAHINTINDYSLYLIIAIGDYCYNMNDYNFASLIWDRIKALYDFVVSRLNEKGYVVPMEGDWIFIDWSDMDKSGVLAAEQILLWKVYNVMAVLSEKCEKGESKKYYDNAEKMKKNIMNEFWDEKNHRFFDLTHDGKRQVTRHSNIFAVLYDFTDETTARKIVESVLYKDEFTKITTPYFKLYELIALCKTGDIEIAQKFIEEYWGGMLDNGATTVWEEYDPEKSGSGHYEMYGHDYGKSLCHAWGSGPILLLNKFCCGVKPTSAGYETFEVKPNPGIYKSFEASVPIKDGIVHLKYSNNSLSVTSDRDGGKLVIGETEYVLYPNETKTVDFTKANK